jgi:hypothetical protein
MHANPQQKDFDADGVGDVCDGDDDADGVDDDSDLCPGTPISASFDVDGCSGAQRVALACGSVEDHHRVGRYVACVVKEARAARRVGLLTFREKAILVRGAVLQAIRETFERWRGY